MSPGGLERQAVVSLANAIVRFAVAIPSSLANAGPCEQDGATVAAGYAEEQGL